MGVRLKSTKFTEKEFMAQVVKLAKLRGWLVYHTHDSRRSVAGFPDLMFLRGAWIIVAELKVGKNKTTPEQQQWLNAFNAAGIETHLWRPEDWAFIERTLLR